MENLDELTREQLLERIGDELEKAKPGAMNPAGANVHAGRAQVYASLLVERALRDR